MPSLLTLLRVWKEVNQPPRSVYKVPSHTRFIKIGQTPFPLPNQFRSKKNMHTQQNTKLWNWGKLVWATKRVGKIGKSTPRWVIQIQKLSWEFYEPKWLLWTPKSWILDGRLLSNTKTNFLGMENEETSRKTWGRQPNPWALQKWPPIQGKDEVNDQNCGWIHTGSSSFLRELTWIRENGEEDEKHEWRMPRAPKRGVRQRSECMREWAVFLGNNLPHKSKSCFPKTDGFSHSNLDYHTFPIPYAITNSTNF